MAAEPTGPSSKTTSHVPTASAALRTLLDDQVAAVQAADGRLRTNGWSGIHRMRVALRRLRSTLTTFRPFLDDSVDELREELRWFASELSPARNAEVMRTRLTTACAEDHRLGPDAVGALEPFLQRDEEVARVRVEDAWESERYAALSPSLVRLYGSEVITITGDVSADEAFLPLVAEAVQRVRRRAERISDAADDSAVDRDELVHDLRKATKRARYASEVLLPFHRRQAAKLERRLERLQVLLGDRQDSAVARELLHRMLASGALDEHGTEVVERLLAHERTVTASLDETLPHRLEKATRPGRLLPR